MKELLTTPDVIDDMPGVTVCIPARNEMHAMTDSLEKVIASTYPKLEIIVLDDVSGDDTSVLIKSFAHAGVRFVEGTALPDGWLGRNHALQELLKEASGTYIFFMDVDTHVAPDTIEQLVAYARQEDALMVSVLPRREDGPRASVIFSTLRYFWEIMFNRKEAPATSSSAWLIDRETLIKKWRGFEPFKATIQPESKISAQLAKTDQYRFLMGTSMLGVSYEKKWRSQVETSVRLLYPLLGGKIAHAVIGALDLLIVAGPLFVVMAGFFFGWGVHQLISGFIVLLFAALYASYLKHVWNRSWLLGGLLWPYIILQELVLLIMSAERYTRRAVTWKGRVVHLPKS
jgi:glycosyltransferase involved in cell wall biosynthesis